MILIPPGLSQSTPDSQDATRPRVYSLPKVIVRRILSLLFNRLTLNTH